MNLNLNLNLNIQRKSGAKYYVVDEIMLQMYQLNEYPPIINPLQGKGLISDREGTSIDHHACSRRFGDFRLMLSINPGHLMMFFLQRCHN